MEVTQFGEAWDKLMEWMTTSGYQPDDRMCYEMYLNDPDTIRRRSGSSTSASRCAPVGAHRTAVEEAPARPGPPA